MTTLAAIALAAALFHGNINNVEETYELIPRDEMVEYVKLASEYSRYEVDPAVVPIGVLVSPEFMKENACAPKEKECKVVGVYFYNLPKYVFIANDLVGEVKTGIIIHEIMHWQQFAYWRAPEEATCAVHNAREVEAYAVQYMYLVEHGYQLGFKLDLPCGGLRK